MVDEKKYGIENLIKVLDVVLEGGNVVGEIADLAKNNDGNLKWYQYIIPSGKLLDEIVALLGANFNLLIPEMKDLDDAEIAQLEVHFKEKFDIPQDQLEGLVENSLQLLKKLIAIIQEILALIESFKKK